MESDDFGSFTAADKTMNGWYDKCRLFSYDALFDK